MYVKIKRTVLTRDSHNSIGSNDDVALDNILFRSGIVSLLLLLLLSSDVFGIGVGISLVGRIRRCLFGGSQRTRAIEGLSLKEKNQSNLVPLYIFKFLSLSLFLLKHHIFIRYN